jgi:hypothetical protein
MCAGGEPLTNNDRQIDGYTTGTSQPILELDSSRVSLPNAATDLIPSMAGPASDSVKRGGWAGFQRISRQV